MSEVPQDNDPRHIAIMEEWVSKIVREVADEISAGIVKEVGRIFLDAKNSNGRTFARTQQRLDAIEAAIAKLKARKP